MTLLLDTGVLYAYYDRKDDWHERCRVLLEDEAGPLLVPAPVLPEIDFLLGRRLGRDARQLLYTSIVEGDYEVIDPLPSTYRRIFELNEQYRDLDLGWVDAAVLALAEEFQLSRVATTDRRHFGAVELDIFLELLPD